MSTEFFLFVLGGTAAIIALLGDFSRSKLVKAIGVSPLLVRSALCMVGLAVAAIAVIPEATGSSTPQAAAAVIEPTPSTPAAPMATLPDSSQAPSKPVESAPAQVPVTQSNPSLPVSTPSNIEVRDAGNIQVTRREVTVRDVPDSVAREFLKQHPIPMDQMMRNGSASGQRP